MPLPVPCALQPALSTACCAKCRQELFCAGFGASTVGRAGLVSPSPAFPCVPDKKWVQETSREGSGVLPACRGAVLGNARPSADTFWGRSSTQAGIGLHPLGVKPKVVVALRTDQSPSSVVQREAQTAKPGSGLQ